MKKGILALLLMALTSPLMAYNLSIHGDNTLTVIRFQPCADWNYTSSGNGGPLGYTCRWRGTSIVVPDANDLVGILNDMLDKMDAMETRIKVLEKNQDGDTGSSPVDGSDSTDSNSDESSSESDSEGTTDN